MYTASGNHHRICFLDEVYVYGSFTQSKMYHNNVYCTSCHDPHSLDLKFDGNDHILKEESVSVADLGGPNGNTTTFFFIANTKIVKQDNGDWSVYSFQHKSTC